MLFQEELEFWREVLANDARKARAPLLALLEVCLRTFLWRKAGILGEQLLERLPAIFVREAREQVERQERIGEPGVRRTPGGIPLLDLPQQGGIAHLRLARRAPADLEHVVERKEVHGHLGGAGERPVWALVVVTMRVAPI